MTTDKDVKHIQVRLPTDVYDKFVERCEEENLSLNQAFQDLVKASLTTGSIDKIKAYAIVAHDMPGILCFMKDLADTLSRSSKIIGKE